MSDKGLNKRFYDVLVKNSENKNWKKAINEWNIKNITKEEYQTKCICGHVIFQRCVIINKINRIELVVGNCCIKKIPSFKRNFRAYKGLRDNKLNQPLINLAFEKEIIDDWEHVFIIETFRKNKMLSKKQVYYRDKIKEKIFGGLITNE